jgi:hypothetical protein
MIALKNISSVGTKKRMTLYLIPKNLADEIGQKTATYPTEKTPNADSQAGQTCRLQNDQFASSKTAPRRAGDESRQKQRGFSRPAATENGNDFRSIQHHRDIRKNGLRSFRWRK